MSLNIIKYYLTKNRCYQRNVKRKPIGIQLHTIGTAQGTAQAVADYWNQAAVSACVHYIVDCDTPGKVLYTLPEDVRCWGDAGWGNDNLISFEICESDFMSYKGGGASYTITNSSKFKADIIRGYNTSVLLCADICKRYEWDPESKLPNGMYLISSHDEGRRAGISSAHVDPEHIWPRYGLTMAKFRADVKAAMGGTVVTQPQTKEMYRVRKTWTDVESQLFAGTLEGAKKACLLGYSVYDENGKVVYSLEKDGFQASDLKVLTEAERIEKIAPLYQDSMRKTGMLASVGIAQFCLESGYGTTDLAEFANNLHGMKASLSGNTWSGSSWDGVSVYGKESPEVYNGVTKMVYSEFRKYPNCEASIADRAAYFINAMNGSEKRYKGIVRNKDYKAVINIIKNGGYATDPNYVAKLVNLVERWELFRFDDVEMPDKGNSNILPEEEIKWYRVRKSWGTTLDGQIGAYQTLEKAIEKVNENPEYKVFDFEGKIIYEIAKKPTNKNEIHKVQSGAYTVLANAQAQVNALKNKGFSSFVFFEDGYHKVQVGAYEVYSNAVLRMEEVKKAGFPAIIKTYSEELNKKQHVILEQCRKFQERLMSDMEKGIRWEYHNPSKYLSEQWGKALENKKYACNCALLARWALKEAGLIPQNTSIFYGKLGGNISWGKGAKAEVQKTCELINVQNKTVKQLINSGDLLPGDIVTYVGLQHTNIYAGDNKWYDAGHAYCSGSGEGALFNSWYGVGQYDNQKVGWIIRKK